MVKLLLICALVTLSISANVLAEDEWWEYGHFYQVYPRSFQDSDGDGIGDINGITSRLPYLKGIGVTGIWLSPIFKSPMKDFGYDISDFKAIQPEYGTMEDFENLSKRCKELDIKLILDYVPNHCSSEHEWFKKALDRNDPEHEKYKNYFIWNKGKLSENGTRLPPSNWLSIFRGSAWEYVEDLEEYYLHQFLEEQPDLNFRNQELADEMKDVLRFWLEKGANGFRIDAIPFIYESKENADGFYDDEPRSGECNDDPDASCYLNHTETKDQDETYEMLYQWREVMEEPQFADVTRILMVEGYTSFDMTMKYYGEVKNGEIVRYGAQMPFNFMLMSNTWSGTGTYGYVENIVKLLDNLPKGDRIRANWVLGNHDNKRIASRNRPSRIDLFNILLKTLPGIAVTYYGEEIGMTNVFISWEDTVDPQACRTNPEIYEGFSRDPERTPFQWDDTKNAGFSTGDNTWLPVALNYTDCNVDLQESLARSHLKVFRQLMELRENPTFKYGKLQIEPVDTEVLVYKREIEDDADADADVFVVVLNLETSFKTVDLTRHLSKLPERLEVMTSSTHATLNVGDIVYAKKMEISPEAGVVLKSIKEF